jgi:hypothetical protein
VIIARQQRATLKQSFHIRNIKNKKAQSQLYPDIRKIFREILILQYIEELFFFQNVDLVFEFYSQDHFRSEN